MTPSEYNTAVDLHADGIYRFALKHLRDEELAKDVVQESFARLWSKVEEVDGGQGQELPLHHRTPRDGGRGAKGTT